MVRVGSIRCVCAPIDEPIHPPIPTNGTKDHNRERDILRPFRPRLVRDRSLPLSWSCRFALLEAKQTAYRTRARLRTSTSAVIRAEDVSCRALLPLGGSGGGLRFPTPNDEASRPCSAPTAKRSSHLRPLYRQDVRPPTSANSIVPFCTFLKYMRGRWLLAGPSGPP